MQSGATVGQAASASALNAMMGTTEALPLGGMLERINKGTGGKLAQVISHAVREAGEEATQEALQQVFQNAVASDGIGYDPQRGW